MSAEGSYPILARDLTKRFGGFTAVDGISFEVNRGEIFGFLGPNGSGKTTTIRMLLGLIPPNQGEVEILGLAVDGNTSLIRKRVGYMSQRFSLYNDLTVMQNLQFYGTAYGLTNAALKDRIMNAIQMSGLEGREQVETRELSGGWRQRLALSAAIIHEPEVVFLDEPTAGVDPVSRRAFWDLLYRLVESGITVFVTTHYMDEAEHCHRLGFIQRGRLIAYGSPGDIKRSFISGQVLELDSSNPVNAVQILREIQASNQLPIEDVELYGALIHVVLQDAQKNKKAILKILEKGNIQVQDVSVIEPSLEDVFIACMRS